MSVGLILLAVIAASNPAATAVSLARATESLGRTHRYRLLLAAAAIALTVALALVLAAGDIAEGLELKPESFRTAAGGIVVFQGARMLIFGPLRPPGAPSGWWGAIVPAAWPVLLAPEFLAAAMTASIDEGRGWGVLAVAVTVAGAAAAALGLVHVGRENAFTGAALGGLARLIAALAIALGVGLVVSGVRDV